VGQSVGNESMFD